MATKKTKKNLEYYMDLSWSWTVEPSEEEGHKFYILRVNELPGVCTDVDDLADAEDAVQEVISSAIELYLKRGEVIPEPIDKSKCRGEIAYRTTPERHHRLLREVQRRKRMNQPASLNRVIDELVDEASFTRRPSA